MIRSIINAITFLVIAASVAIQIDELNVPLYEGHILLLGVILLCIMMFTINMICAIMDIISETKYEEEYDYDSAIGF